MGLLHRASLLAARPRPLSSSSAFTANTHTRLPLLQHSRRTLCMPPGPSLRYSSVENAPPPTAADEDVFESLTKAAKTACPSESDGITPEAALQELRRLTPELAQLGIHHPTPVAPFTDVDPLTGEMAPKAPKKNKSSGFFTRVA